MEVIMKFDDAVKYFNNPLYRDFLKIKIGPYRVYDLLINDLIANRTFIKREKMLKRVSFLEIVKKMVKLVKIKKIDNDFVDIVFFSRYRPKRSRNCTNETDYLFYNIIERLDNNYRCGLVTLGLNEKKYSDRNCINYNIKDFLDIKTIVQSLILSIKIIIEYKKLTNSLDRFAKKYNHVFSPKKIFGWTLLGLGLNNLLRNLNPKIIVSNDDLFFRRKPEGTYTKLIIVQSANMNKDLEIQRSTLLDLFLEKSYKPDLFTVSGPFFYDVKKKNAIDYKKLIITGQSRFDHLIEKKNSNNMIKNLNPSKKTVVWATQTHGLTEEENKKNIIAMSELLENSSEINLLIKFHPAENQKETIYDGLEKKHQNCLIINNEHVLSDLSELLSLSDILITKNSTTAIEASLMDKDILIVDYVRKSKNRYVEDGIAIGAYEPIQVKQEIYKLLNDDKLKEKLLKQRKKFNYRYNYLNDGKASVRIARIIEKEIESSSDSNLD